IDIRGIDEVDAIIGGMSDNALRLAAIGRPAKHHGAEANLRDLYPAATQQAIAHLWHQPCLLAFCSGCRPRAPLPSPNAARPSPALGNAQTLGLRVRCNPRRPHRLSAKRCCGRQSQRSTAPAMLSVATRKRRAASSPVFDDKTIDAPFLAVFDEHITS